MSSSVNYLHTLGADAYPQLLPTVFDPTSIVSTHMAEIFHYLILGLCYHKTYKTEVITEDHSLVWPVEF